MPLGSGVTGLLTGRMWSFLLDAVWVLPDCYLQVDLVQTFGTATELK